MACFPNFKDYLQAEIYNCFLTMNKILSVLKKCRAMMLNLKALICILILSCSIQHSLSCFSLQRIYSGTAFDDLQFCLVTLRVQK